MESSDDDSTPPGFPFRKRSRGKKPLTTCEDPRLPGGSSSRGYRGETSSSRPPEESSSIPYQGDTSSIVCRGDSSSPCCQGEPSSSASNFSDDDFPVGLRVLLVDDDQTCLTIVSQLLTECRYEVTCCNHPRLALSILRERRGEIDMVITDVYMPEIDGFKLLELVAMEMDVPVVMMSVDCGVEVARRGIENGACYYLMKPVSKEELRNVWQHVFLWRKNLLEQGGTIARENREVNQEVNQEMNPEVNLPPEVNPPPEYPEPVVSTNEDDAKTSKRSREDKEGKERNCGDEVNENCTMKKHRVIWTADLHNHFLKAVNQLGYDKAVPKKILEIMDVPGITRENIASHLQKYRIFLRRLSSDPDLPVQPSPRQTLGETTRTKNWIAKYRAESGNRHCAWKVIPPGFLPGFPEYVPPSNAPPLPPLNHPTHYADPGQSRSSSAGVDFRQPLAGGMEDFEQTPPGFDQTSPPYAMQPNDANPEFGMDPNLMRMSPPPSYEHGPMMGSSTIPMVNQQQGMLTGLNSSAPYGNYHGQQGVVSGNYHWQGIHVVSSCPSMVNYSGIPPCNYTGLCMTSTGGLYGVTRTGPIFEASASDNSIGSLFDEIKKGKRPMVEEDEEDYLLPEIDIPNVSYNNQESGSFSVMVDPNRNADLFANVGQREENAITKRGNDVSDGNHASLGESSLPQQSDDGDLDDVFFQQLEGLEFTLPDFDFSSFNLGDNPPAR